MAWVRKSFFGSCLKIKITYIRTLGFMLCSNVVQNIIQYGGGKTIRPGEVLETAESKAAKQARTRQMIAAYNRQMGLLIDPKLKADCEKVCLKLDGTVFTCTLLILSFEH